MSLPRSWHLPLWLFKFKQYSCQARVLTSVPINQSPDTASFSPTYSTLARFNLHMDPRPASDGAGQLGLRVRSALYITFYALGIYLWMYGYATCMRDDITKSMIPFSEMVCFVMQ